VVAAAGVMEELDAALGGIDDRVALVGGRPVAIDSLWRTALRSLHCAADGTVVVHPSWWSSSRVGMATAAAESLPGDVLVRPRSWLLTQAPHAGAEVVVEIAERLVAIVGAEVIGIPRNSESLAVAEEVARAIDEICSGTTTTVLIDAPRAVAGAAALAASIARLVRASGRSATEIDATRLSKLAASAQSTLAPRSEPPPRSVPRVAGARWRAFGSRGLVAVAVVLAAAVPIAAAVGHHGVPPTAATTFLVEGRVALTVPADWIVQRVLGGPGSARVQVTSPADPEVALHVTQSPVPPDETLSATAERLQRAIGSEPGGVFVDFNPSGVSAGRPAVTYREVRASHQVRWTVVLDGPVRISVGCQSRPGADDVVHNVCEQAVRSARAIG
jgi:type VII secretion-associated protein (TIGR03931 family)